MKPLVHIVWFKRDLRITDHAALYTACQQEAILPIYCWDNMVWQGSDYAKQHQVFVEECLDSLNQHLQTLGLSLIMFKVGMLEALQRIAAHYTITGLYSHEETGNDDSYRLDLAVHRWCKAQNILWHEFAQNGVVRRLKNRDTWAAHWQKRMFAPLVPLPAGCTMPAGVNRLRVDDAFLFKKIEADKPLRQTGGRDAANKVLHTFLNGRGSRYRGGISSPISSESAGSRLSPYLTWGVLSMREVVQSLRQQKLHLQTHANLYPKHLLKGLIAFESRLHWHCHFIQKLESEPTIEYQNLHPAFNQLRDADYTDAQLKVRLNAWRNGQTGWPLVDACMAMLRQTGWVNFRMRAMLMSTASYLLWLHWRETGLHLAREFLDYEPGIHWSQVQMQSGTTGINTLRIYNPIKQAIDQDPEGVFVRHWIPALRNVPTTWIFQPWRMPASLQEVYDCRIGTDYPAPLVDISMALKEARAKFSQCKQHALHHAHTMRIIQTHASRKGDSHRKGKSGSSRATKKIVKTASEAGQQNLF